MPIPPEVRDLALDLGKAAVLALSTYVAHGVRALKRNGQRVDRIENILDGIDRNNGLRKAVVTVEEVTKDHEKRITRLEERTA